MLISITLNCCVDEVPDNQIKVTAVAAQTCPTNQFRVASKSNSNASASAMAVCLEGFALDR